MAQVVHSPPIGFVVAVVNGWASAVRHDDHAVGGAGPAFPDWATIGDRWGIALPSVGDLAISGWADRVYRIFAAEPADRIRAANDLLGSLALRPVLVGVGADSRLGWRCPDGDSVGALLAGGLIRYAIEADPGLAHLGTCVGVRCRDAYVDQSQGRTRRYCSSRCQNRTKTYRRRGQA